MDLSGKKDVTQTLPLPFEASEEVLYTGIDRAWHGPVSVRLVTYEDGRQDLRRSPGLDFHEHIDQAREILRGRGLDVGPVEQLGPTGAYLTVFKAGNPPAHLKDRLRN